MQNNSKKTMTLMALIMMIFTNVYGLTNIMKAFWLMGYSSIIWYVVGAVLFFIPFAFMLAEFGAAFKDSKGGIYSWMAESVNPKFAFIGFFMWYVSFIIWFVSTAPNVIISISNMIFGTDTTQSWHLFGLNSVQTLGILGVILIIGLTYVSTKGLSWVTKITNFGGAMVMIFNLLIFVVGITILIKNGHFMQPVTLHAFMQSPNKDYRSIIQVFSFLVFAIFAYGGIEVVSGVTDETENPEKTFPKAITISAIVIALGYALGILVVGIFTDWNFVFHHFSRDQITMGNVSYVVISNMGYQMGLAFHMSPHAAMILGEWISRFMGLSMFTSLLGAVVTGLYSPIKQLIDGTPKEIWPRFLTKTKGETPVNAIYVQAAIVCVIILLTSFGGQNATSFFNILVAMTNVSMTIPYMFISYAFYGFKKNQNIEKPFVIFKKQRTATLMVWVVTGIVGIANIFTIIEPAIDGDWAQTIWSVIGPVFFTAVALIMYHRYEQKMKKSL